MLCVSDFGCGGEVTCFCKPRGTRELWFYTSEIFPNESAVSVVQSFRHSCHHTSMLGALRLLQVWYYEVLCFVFPISLCYFLFVLSYSYLPSSVISSSFLYCQFLLSFSSLYSVVFFAFRSFLSLSSLLISPSSSFLLNPLLLFIIFCLSHPILIYISLSSCCFFFFFYFHLFLFSLSSRAADG